MKRLGFVFVLISALAVPAAAAPLPEALRTDLTHYLATRAKAEHISALSLSVWMHGRSRIDVTAGRTRFGGGGAPVTPSNLFQIGSNTKAFTAVTLLQLEAEGRLNIEQRLGRWLPQYPAWKNVTIRRLLDMTSGIPGYDNVDAVMHALALDPSRNFSAKELIAAVYPNPKPALPATTGWSYSNTNYLLAQLIIERVTGRSYALEIRRRFLANPALGLRSTYYNEDLSPPAVLRRLVAGYFFNSDAQNAPLRPLLGKDISRASLSWMQGAGGLISTPQDVTRWSRALYVGPLLPAKQRRELTTIVSDATGKPIAKTTLQKRMGFGLGVGQLTLPGMGTFWYYQGETLGYRMVYAYLPKSDLTIAIGLNSQPPGKQDKVGELMAAVYATLRAAGKT